MLIGRIVNRIERFADEQDGNKLEQDVTDRQNRGSGSGKTDFNGEKLSGKRPI